MAQVSKTWVHSWHHSYHQADLGVSVDLPAQEVHLHFIDGEYKHFGVKLTKDEFTKIAQMAGYMKVTEQEHGTATFEDVVHTLAMSGEARIGYRKTAHNGIDAGFVVITAISDTHVSGLRYSCYSADSSLRPELAFRVKHDGRKFTFGGGTSSGTWSYWFKNLIK